MTTDDVSRFACVKALLRDAVARRVFPCATLEVGTTEEVLFQDACGRHTYDHTAPAATIDTIFDLASMTKVLATTTIVMRLIDEGLLTLNDPVGQWVSAWQGADRRSVTLADLLEHASGLTAHLPFYRDHTGRTDFEHAISTLPLEYPPRTRSIYSDLGFILLGFLATDAAGGVDLERQFSDIAQRLQLGDVRYRPPMDWRPRTAPTEVEPWRGRLLCGEVHDENGWALGGIAGHTGLFGTAPAVGRFARALLQTRVGRGRMARPGTLTRFLTPTTVPGSSRALGWDTMLPTSSCGQRLSADAVGHTGFTGTSLWIDPKQELYVVFLTNRVHPTRANEDILAVRPAVHNAIVEALAL
jgi:CubicO group peptidase (beta-lactamase class C family)